MARPSEFSFSTYMCFPEEKEAKRGKENIKWKGETKIWEYHSFFFLVSAKLCVGFVYILESMGGGGREKERGEE